MLQVTTSLRVVVFCVMLLASQDRIIIFARRSSPFLDDVKGVTTLCAPRSAKPRVQRIVRADRA